MMKNYNQTTQKQPEGIARGKTIVESMNKDSNMEHMVNTHRRCGWSNQREGRTICEGSGLSRRGMKQKTNSSFQV